MKDTFQPRYTCIDFVTSAGCHSTVADDIEKEKFITVLLPVEAMGTTSVILGVEGVKRFVDIQVADQADACMERVVKVWTGNLGDILIAGVGFTCLRPMSSANRRFQSSRPPMEMDIWKLLKRLLLYCAFWADVKTY